MEAYQQRVVEEHADLVQKIGKLQSFVDGELFTSIPPPEQHRLMRQLYLMGQYAAVLQERIDAFPK